jgi:hypothetical protein
LNKLNSQMDSLPPPPGVAGGDSANVIRARNMSEVAKIIVTKAEEIKKGADLLLVKGNAEDAVTKVIYFFCDFIFLMKKLTA